MLRTFSKLSANLRKLWTCKAGATIIYVAFGLPIMLGAMALSIDLGRSFILNTELKDFSDAAALAGAAELDGRPGARAAAEAAARTGLSGTLLNVQGFATDGGGPNIVIDKVVFLRDLPADGTDFHSNDTATGDDDARFVFVSVVNRNVRAGLSRGLGAVSDFDTGARSIAGFTSVVCKVPAMFMCNPLEDVNFPIAGTTGCSSSDLGVGKPVKHDCLVGRGMLLKNGGGGGNGSGTANKKSDNTESTTTNYFPGEFGLLNCPDGLVNNNNGIRCVAETIAMASPNVCITNRAFPQTGQGAGPIRQAINTRFDAYDNPFFGGSTKNDPNFRPALNVTKGYEPGSGANCAEPADPSVVDVAALPRDDCFYNDPQDCAGGDRYGPGDWHANGRGDDYWTKNHGATPQPAGYADMTRYEVYRYEIESMGFPLSNSPGVPRPPAAGGAAIENGLSCLYNAPGADPADPAYPEFSDPSLDADNEGLDEIDRRLLRLAAVNCIEHGPLTGATPEGIPVEGHVEVFLTEPTTKNGNEGLRVWGELKGVLEVDDGVQDLVQLYR